MVRIEFDDLPSLDELRNIYNSLVPMPMSRGFVILAFYLIEVLFKKLHVRYLGFYYTNFNNVGSYIDQLTSVSDDVYRLRYSVLGDDAYRAVRDIDFALLGYSNTYSYSEKGITKELLMRFIVGLFEVHDKLG